MSDETLRLPSDNPSALPSGTRLGEFEVLSVLGVGGFGIVYLAFDHALEREVAVKEYMPASLAARTATLHVSVRSRSDADTFALGLRSFVNEARLLARFNHPSLLKVHRFWETNGTAYMAMPVMRGRTVKDTRAEMLQPPDEAWLRALLTPLLGAIENLHSEGVYHRDIAPDNIQIEPDGHPVLLDFGAARRVISDKSQTLTAILKPAYAPIEQYGEAGAVRQGPWTDFYALGATLHYLLLNRPPPPATARAVHDEVSALTPEACPGCSETFLRTIDWMLAPRPADRPQSVAALREVLDGHANPPRRRAETQPPPSQWDRSVVLDPAQPAVVIAPRTTPAPPPVPTSLAASSAPEVNDDSTRVLPRVSQPPLRAAAVSTVPRDAAASAGGRPKWLPLAAGATVVALAAVAFALWPRSPTVVAADAAPAAASAAVLAAPNAVPSPTVNTAPASALHESAVTTVAVPDRPGSPVTQTVAPPPATPLAATPAVVNAPDPKPPATVRQSSPTTTPPPYATQAPTATRVPELSRATQPEPLRSPPVGQAPPAGAQAQPAQPAVATGPEAKCGGRNPLRYFVCMERECLRSGLAGHTDCVKWRAEARSDSRN